MNFTPTIFCHSSQSLLTSYDIFNLNQLNSSVWTRDIDDYRKYDYCLTICCSKAENSTQWFSCFTDLSGLFTPVESILAKQKTLRLTTLKIIDHSDIDTFDDNFKEISLQQIQNFLVPFIQSHLASRPSFIEHLVPNFPKIHFADRSCRHLQLVYSGQNSLHFLKHQLEYDHLETLELRGAWPAGTSHLTAEFFKKPSCKAIDTIFVHLPKKTFSVMLDRFIQNQPDMELTGPTELTLKDARKFYAGYQHQTSCKSGILWIAGSKWLYAVIKNGFVAAAACSI
ncbi:hypothetical protein L596_009553 [Steinernema carpocapsae]|uniref:Uncharacterized protein n=1 Tax=Steinernema carpocapsae TaxID=34508 RepID=A0A4U5PH01_STECR|nr:hypothetical protein L596_009553 [Steinernema carpocapsae]